MFGIWEEVRPLNFCESEGCGTGLESSSKAVCLFCQFFAAHVGLIDGSGNVLSQECHQFCGIAGMNPIVDAKVSKHNSIIDCFGAVEAAFDT